jgi:hypothetical protein
MYDSEFVKSKGDKGRSLPPEQIFTEEKILIQRTRRGMKRKLVCYFDTEQYCNLNRLSNVILENKSYQLKYIYAILNSKLLDYYFNKHFNEYEVKPFHLSKLPIKIISFNDQQPFSDKAYFMLVKNKELQQCRHGLLKLLQAKHEGLTITNKLADWPSLTFGAFLKELQKQKITWSLPEQSEWMPYFESEQQKAAALQQEIAQTDAEIDALVEKGGTFSKPHAALHGLLKKYRPGIPPYLVFL